MKHGFGFTFILPLAALVLTCCASHPSLPQTIPASTREAASIDRAQVAPAWVPILADDADSNRKWSGSKARFPTRNKYVGIYNNPQYTPLMDLVNRAKKTIDIEIYMMTDFAFRTALRKALARKVNIRIVKDPSPLGENCGFFNTDLSLIPPTPSSDLAIKISPDCLDQRKLMSEIKLSGGSVVAFDKQQLCGQIGNAAPARCFEHGKIVIIDRVDLRGRLALISTGNFNSSNLCVLDDKPTTCNRDYSYVTRDPIVISGLVKIFEDDFKQIKFKNDRPELEGKLTVSPYTKKPLIKFIESAVTRIQVQNQYMKDRDINAALMAAARRGVAVEMMLASDCSFFAPKEPVRTTLANMYTELESAGVKLRFFTAQIMQRQRKGYLHAKAIVVDDQRAWVGSTNGSSTSLDVNREYGIFFSQPARVKFLSSVMSADWADSLGETWQEAFSCKRDFLTPEQKALIPVDVGSDSSATE